MQLAIEQQDAVITFGFWETLLALKHTLRIPLSHVTAITIDKPVSRRFELRLPGSFIPGVIKSGTYVANDGSEFWYVTRSFFKRALIVELAHDRYTRIVIGGDMIDNWQNQLVQAKSFILPS